MRDSPRRAEPLRIALCTGAYQHIADGVSLTLNRLVGYLGDQGIDVRVFAPTSKVAAVEPQGTVVSVPSVTAPGRPDYRVSIPFSGALRRTLETFDPHLVHVATPDLLGRWMTRWATSRKVPVVATYHTHFASYLQYYRLGWLEPLLWRLLQGTYQQCEHLYVPTATMQKLLEEKQLGAKLLLWPRGVETDTFSPSNRDDDFRLRVGAGPRDVIVLWVSRLVTEKAPHLFAEAVKHVHPPEGTRIIPVIVGAGPARAAMASMLPEAIFLGTLRGEHLARAYASSDVFLFPSDTETFGNVTLEAMSSGLPCITANATGSASLVEHTHTGLLVDAGDARGFQAALQMLVDDPIQRTTLGRAGRERALSFDWDVILARMIGYYRMIPPLEPHLA